MDGDGDDVATQCCRRRRRRLGADMACRVLAGRRVRHRADICDRKQEGEKKCSLEGCFASFYRAEGMIREKGGRGEGGGKAGSRVWKRKGRVANNIYACVGR